MVQLRFENTNWTHLIGEGKTELIKDLLDNLFIVKRKSWKKKKEIGYYTDLTVKRK